MRKIQRILIAVLLVTSFVSAECYFQSRRSSYRSKTKVQKISCGRALKAVEDIEFYNSYNSDNYARTFGREFGQEGNLIVDDEAGGV